MNYCCEAYTSLYREPCGYHKNRYDALSCPQIDPSNLRLRYRDLLYEPGDGPLTLKPKSDVCPFCNEDYTYAGRGELVDQWEDLPDATRTYRAERHIAQEPDMDAGAALVRRLFLSASC